MKSFINLFLIFIAVLLCWNNPLYAGYEIKGTINLSNDWQQQIFLSTINKLDDYYSANPEDIIQVGYIEEDGRFTISGDNLPPEKRFYRLYTVKKDNSEFDACLYVGGDDHNFIHLLMDNMTQVKIKADSSQFAPFGNYEVEGNEENALLKDLSRLVYPSFYFHQIKFPSELQFSQEKLNRDLFQFAENCASPLVSLAAIVNTDMDKYCDLEMERYQNLGDRLRAKLSNHSYTSDYFRKLQYHSGLEIASNRPVWLYIFIALLVGALLAALLVIRSLKKRIDTLLLQQNEKASTTNVPKPVHFTPQEERILTLIMDGKTNKEIAASLFIELSTVKTHINKLYGKIGVKNRTEAKLKGKALITVNQ